MTSTEPTACPVEECDETVDYKALYDHLYGDHDAPELCATIANLVADTEQLRARVADLKEDSLRLHALQAFGVDNWGGYSDAMASLDDEDDEDPDRWEGVDFSGTTILPMPAED